METMMNMSMEMIKNTIEMVIIMFMQSISRIVTIGRSASQEIVAIITVRYMVAFNTHKLNTGLQRARFVHEERVKLELC